MTPPAFGNLPLLLDPRAWSQVPEAAAAIGAAKLDDWYGPGYEVMQGVAVIQVSGILVPRLGTLASWGFATGYDGIRANLAAALDDDAVEAVAMLVASPGGLVSGLFDLADTIYAARGSKPIWAICDDYAYSAAYAIVSACDRVSVPATGGTGSVGVICALMDLSGYFEKAGVVPHFVTYGKRKAAETRAQYEGVTPEVLKGMQADVDLLGEMFVASVARNRGISTSAVREQEADTFMGEAGVNAGLADIVASADAAFLQLLDSLG